MQRICVFCGSSRGARPSFVRAARELGEVLVNRKLGLVYGGGRVGLMYELAREVHDRGGEVIGVMPQALVDREVAYRDLEDLRIVGSMHERKALMAELSDGFVALPGGIGTFEETFEILTWGQLGIHKKPCGLLNVDGFYDKLLEFLDHAVAMEFLARDHLESLLVETDPDGLLSRFEKYVPPSVDKARLALEEMQK
jgi:uncharacterized protein (TIGR00730 family)